MMLINLSKLLSGDQETITEQVTLEMEAFVSSIGTFPVVEKRSFPLKVSKIGADKFLIEGETAVTLDIPCDRCLTPVKVEIPLNISREYDKNTVEEEAEDENLIVGYNLDAEQLIYCEILVNWPMKTLCTEACKGICKKCGANLNHSSCTCDTVELDPRMAKIRDIFNNAK
ncbi:MAG: DUF177 domain-containing protein [Lachnospiraceae bacterium]|nr:DUF177 domain-containing protein [Lachnospiraceae bacterium]MEE1015581.1 DUF177 domain-containing protein [Lachnospiraceae bacterium]